MFEPFSLESLYYYSNQKIEDFIEALAAEPNPNDLSRQYALAKAAGLNLNNLTSFDIEYIEKEVAKRWRKRK